MDQVDDLDMESDGKYQALYDRALTQEYPYVQKIRKSVYRSFNELIDMFPDPDPSTSYATHLDATVLGSTENAEEKPSSENPENQGGDAQDSSVPS